MLGAALALVANALAVIAVAYVLPNQVSYTSWTAVGIFAVVVGFLNAVLRPLVQALTAPIGCLTLGLFSIVINGLMFWLAARIHPGSAIPFVDASFLGATITALLAGLLNGTFGAITTERRERRW